MIFDETIVHWVGSSPAKYGMAVLNPDGSLVGGGASQSTPYTMLAYYESDATYNYSYYAEATPGSSTGSAVWRCFRVQEEITTGNFISKKWAGTSFNNLGDETTVKGLTYS